MKQTAWISVALSLALSGMATVVQADTITYSKDIYQAGSNAEGSALEANNDNQFYGTSDTLGLPTTFVGGASTITWTFDVKETGWAKLEIVAEGIDLGEIDYVSVFAPDNSLVAKEQLVTQGFYWSGSGLFRGAGALGEQEEETDLTTTIINFWIKQAGIYTIKVDTASPSDIDGISHSWVNEIETSKLSITPVPEPTTTLLFGSGLVGLAALSRKKRS